MNKCSYRIEGDSPYSCGRSVRAIKANRCILHTPIDELENPGLALSFSNRLRQELRDFAKKNSETPFDMSGFNFPEDFRFPPIDSFAVKLRRCNFADIRVLSELAHSLGDIPYLNFPFRGGALFSELEVDERLELLNFDKTVRGDISFQKCSFSAGLEIEDVNISGVLEISNTSSQDLILSEVEADLLQLCDCKFEDGCIIHRSDFQRIKLLDCRVDEGLYLRFVNQNETHRAEPDDMGFSGSYEFEMRRCELKGLGELSVCSLFGRAVIESCQFGKGFRITGSDRDVFHDLFLYSENTIASGSTFDFDNVCLRKACFPNASLENMRFHLVEWHPVRAWLKTDPAAYQLYNYLLFPDRPDIMEHIVEQYRQLVKHYEERRDFESAERFYVSEMELRRSLLGMPIYESGMSARVFLWIRRKFNFYSLYRLSSLYGTRYFQAIGVLLLLIAGGTQILMFTGIKPSEENKDAGRHEIDYLLFSAESRPTSEHVLRDYWDSFTYTVDSVTLQKNKNFEPNLGKVAQIIIFLSVAAQGAMFLLALRRRFKRD